MRLTNFLSLFGCFGLPKEEANQTVVRDKLSRLSEAKKIQLREIPDNDVISDLSDHSEGYVGGTDSEIIQPPLFETPLKHTTSDTEIAQALSRSRFLNPHKKIVSADSPADLAEMVKKLSFSSLDSLSQIVIPVEEEYEERHCGGLIV